MDSGHLRARGSWRRDSPNRNGCKGAPDEARCEAACIRPTELFLISLLSSSSELLTGTRTRRQCIASLLLECRSVGRALSTATPCWTCIARASKKASSTSPALVSVVLVQQAETSVTGVDEQGRLPRRARQCLSRAAMQLCLARALHHLRHARSRAATRSQVRPHGSVGCRIDVRISGLRSNQTRTAGRAGVKPTSSRRCISDASPVVLR